jgi:hypothetical protein
VLQVNYIFVGAKPGTWGEVGANPTLSRMPFLLSEAPALQGFQGCQNSLSHKAVRPVENWLSVQIWRSRG